MSHEEHIEQSTAQKITPPRVLIGGTAGEPVESDDTKVPGGPAPSERVGDSRSTSQIPPRKKYSPAELLALSSWRRVSEICDAIHARQSRLIESDEIGAVIDPNDASGFVLDVAEFEDEDIEVHGDQIRLEFRFSLTGETHNYFSGTSSDVTIDGSATAIIQQDGSLLFEDVQVDGGPDEEDEFEGAEDDDDYY